MKQGRHPRPGGELRHSRYLLLAVSSAGHASHQFFTNLRRPARQSSAPRQPPAIRPFLRYTTGSSPRALLLRLEAPSIFFLSSLLSITAFISYPPHPHERDACNGRFLLAISLTPQHPPVSVPAAVGNCAVLAGKLSPHPYPTVTTDRCNTEQRTLRMRRRACHLKSNETNDKRMIHQHKATKHSDTYAPH